MRVQRLSDKEASLFQQVLLSFEREPFSEQRIQEILGKSHHIFLVAWVDEQIAGLCFAHILDRWSRPVPHLFIYEIEVLPAFQRQGVGTQLIHHAMSYVEGESFVITAHDNMPARALYEACGFQVKFDHEVVYVHKG